ncbi:hypothetical protein MMC17_008912 [Xylographa soralifera]|nr:hypothetical protein [Xylographa soralifera]
MAPTYSKKRKLDDTPRNRTSRPKKKFRKQTDYASSSSPSADEFDPVDLAGSESTSEQEIDIEASTNPSKQQESPTRKAPKAADGSSLPSHDSASNSSNSDPDTSDSDSDPEPTHPTTRPLPKRKDPSVFSTSLSTILSTKLPTSSRSDPVLARSATAKEAAHALAEGKLETKARKAFREEKKNLSDKGRVRDVVLGDRVTSSSAGVVGVDEQGGAEDNGASAAEILEQERRLRKTAQRGVVKLFNAVRAAQVKGEEARREARKVGVVGAKRKEERVGEMGRKAFLELVAGGGAGS